MIFERNGPFGIAQTGTKNPAILSTDVAKKWRGLTVYLNLFRVLRALERLHNFRSLDDAALRDVGLSRKDVDRATLKDFLKAH